MNTTQSVTVSVVGGPSATVPWSSGMNAQQALEGAYNIINNQRIYLCTAILRGQPWIFGHDD